MHCSICYAYRLNDEVPEVACDDSRCGQLFHSACLIEVAQLLSVVLLIETCIHALLWSCLPVLTFKAS